MRCSRFLSKSILSHHAWYKNVSAVSRKGSMTDCRGSIAVTSEANKEAITKYV